MEVFISEIHVLFYNSVTLEFLKMLLRWGLAGMVVHTLNPSTWGVETKLSGI